MKDLALQSRRRRAAVPGRHLARELFQLRGAATIWRGHGIGGGIRQLPIGRGAARAAAVSCVTQSSVKRAIRVEPAPGPGRVALSIALDTSRQLLALDYPAR